MRAVASARFENWLRKEVHKRGYVGPETAITENYEYDIIGIREETNCIILADAKYRDLSPSSLTGANLLKQEVLGPHGLRDEAERQEQRLALFLDDSERFRKHLNPKRPWKEYKVDNYIITKHVPIAHRYKRVSILRTNEFLERLSRGS